MLNDIPRAPHAHGLFKLKWDLGEATTTTPLPPSAPRGPHFGDRRTFLVRDDRAVEQLYSGGLSQCSSCGLRVEDYAAHLDDHFKENR